ncbi:MAG TPA: wax ester/triacylglycerol synthase family O-acyltransferase [Nocardioidaceae bacterium]|nr:wax ester/triacylglycerol synthase family O-acyltransferase [Nocardioidaceae bacterium]
MNRLSGLDASFLYLESSTQLLHVCGVVMISPETMPEAYSFDTMKAAIGRRISAMPEFLRTLHTVPLHLDHPVWVIDEDFDIDRHVHRLAVPSPGGQEELSEIVGHLAGIPLDRSRPLWEMWVIEGLAGGQIAVFTKMHHATVDGVSGANLISNLCSLEPEAPAVPDRAPDHDRVPSDLELAARGVVSVATKPVELAKLVLPSAGIVTHWIGRARKGKAMPAPFTAPRTSLNGTITGHRSAAFADFDLDDVKVVKRATGATVNDVVLGLVGGALRHYLQERDELPASSLVAMVPVSVHGKSRRQGSNKVSGMFTRLYTDIADPLERIRAIAETNADVKEHHHAIDADTLQDWAHFAAPRTFGMAVRVYSRLRLAEKHPVVHNLVVSNVPGPPVPVYFMGARIEALYPLGPVFHGAGLNVTVMSNNGRMNVGLLACRELAPSVWDLARRIPSELDAALEALSVSHASSD